jgi:hypothetical protein
MKFDAMSLVLVSLRRGLAFRKFRVWQQANLSDADGRLETRTTGVFYNFIFSRPGDSMSHLAPARFSLEWMPHKVLGR